MSNIIIYLLPIKLYNQKIEPCAVRLPRVIDGKIIRLVKFSKIVIYTAGVTTSLANLPYTTAKNDMKLARKTCVGIMFSMRKCVVRATGRTTATEDGVVGVK